jgi:hypothetical protein
MITLRRIPLGVLPFSSLNSSAHLYMILLAHQVALES